jgi:hypothetical protein
LIVESSGKPRKAEPLLAEDTFVSKPSGGAVDVLLSRALTLLGTEDLLLNTGVSSASEDSRLDGIKEDSGL